MSDIRQTMWDIERCLCHVPDACSDCSHRCDRESFPDCMEKLLDDAYQLLKAQQPRVMALEEVHEGDVMWFDSPGNFIMRPVICVMHDKGDSSYLVFAWQYGTFTWRISDYGIGWRCWTAKPSEEQRERVKWNE